MARIHPYGRSICDNPCRDFFCFVSIRIHLRLKIMSASWLIVIYVAVLLGALGGLGIYSEMRRRRFGPAHSADRVFRCTKCGFVFTDDADVDRSRCSQCGKMNEPMAF
jgi:hypothetical protein